MKAAGLGRLVLPRRLCGLQGLAALMMGINEMMEGLELAGLLWLFLPT